MSVIYTQLGVSISSVGLQSAQRTSRLRWVYVKAVCGVVRVHSGASQELKSAWEDAGSQRYSQPYQVRALEFIGVDKSMLTEQWHNLGVRYPCNPHSAIAGGARSRGFHLSENVFFHKWFQLKIDAIEFFAGSEAVQNSVTVLYLLTYLLITPLGAVPKSGSFSLRRLLLVPKGVLVYRLQLLYSSNLILPIHPALPQHGATWAQSSRG